MSSNTNFKTVQLGDLSEDTLLCSILLSEGQSVSRLNLKKLTRADLKVLKNETLAKQRPLHWLKLAVETVVNDIDGTPIKQLSAHLALGDAMYVLYRSHILNFGYILKDVRFACPHCGKESIVELDLKQAQVDVSADVCYSTDTFDFYPEDDTTFTFKDTSYTVESITFRHFTLGDALKYESQYKLNQQSTFLEQVYADCGIAIKCKDGSLFEGTQARMLLFNILNNVLSVKDSSRLEGHFANRPNVHTLFKVECPACSMPADFNSPFFYLFPQRL